MFSLSVEGCRFTERGVFCLLVLAGCLLLFVFVLSISFLCSDTVKEGRKGSGFRATRGV